MIVRKVGPKGQVVIPSDLRELLGIKPRGDVIIDVKDGAVLVRPKRGGIVKHLSSLVPEAEKRTIEEIDLGKYYEKELIKRQRGRR